MKRPILVLLAIAVFCVLPAVLSVGPTPPADPLLIRMTAVPVPEGGPATRVYTDTSTYWERADDQPWTLTGDGSNAVWRSAYDTGAWPAIVGLFGTTLHAQTQQQFTFTAEQERAWDVARKRYNTSQKAANPAHVDINTRDYRTMIINSLSDEYVRNLINEAYAQDVRQAFRAALEAGETAKIDAVATALGVTKPQE